NGQHTFTLTLNSGGPQTVTVTDRCTGVSKAVTITVAAPHLVYAQQPTNTTAGVTISPAVTVQIVDGNGNPIPPLVAGTTASPARASAPSRATPKDPTTVTASASGLATFSDLNLETAGTYTLVASASQTKLGTVVSSSFIVSAATADHLAFAVQPSNTT